MSSEAARQIRWVDLPPDAREALTGKLRGLWGASSDKAAFDSLAEDKQQALLLILGRMQAKQLWDVVRRIENVYGEAGVGLGFVAWPLIKAALGRRRDFTRLLARHKGTSGGFYERGRASVVLHFIYYQAGSEWKWHVHFDLYSPVESPASALRHFWHEVLRKERPDWRMISRLLKA
jgi:hypothetical protein